ncbi:hypothetical protein [Bacillus sp. 1P06AnD]|uniref:hypothetical protein n=1 Tax=Bacillus sp. 1P06AnD TaxID=3132208 RepID=UPI0039A33EC8
MKDFKILYAVDRFRPLLEKVGVDYPVMRNILQLKLLMDARRVPLALGNQTRKKDKETKDKNMFLSSLWIYALCGLFLIIFVVMNQNIVYQMSLFFAVVMFMLMTSLISDFSSVLLDTKDKNIILSKPVSSATLGMAKTIHLMIYMFYITVCLGGPGLIASIPRYGLSFAVVMLIELIVINLFVIVLTVLLYLVILKFFDGEKLKNVINYFQIGLSLALAVGYQLIIRIFDIVDLHIVYTPHWWHILLPPLWYGAPFGLVMGMPATGIMLALTILALVVPVIAIIVYAKGMPAFENSLLKLTQVNNAAKRNKKSVITFMSKIICTSREERILFVFANDILRNEREFKLKVFPSLGLSLVLPFILIFTSIQDTGLKGINDFAFYSIYFTGLMVPAVVSFVQYSEKYKGAWIFTVAPVRSVGLLHKAALKAVTVRYLMPLILIQSVCFTILFGVSVLPDLLAVFLNLLLVALISYSIIHPYLPFSVSYGAIESSGAKLFYATFIIFVLTSIHMGINRLGNMALWIYIAVLAVSVVFFWSRFFPERKGKRAVDAKNRPAAF